MKKASRYEIFVFLVVKYGYSAQKVELYSAIKCAYGLIYFYENQFKFIDIDDRDACYLSPRTMINEE